ncbi:MAG: C40 family peptidase [Janthinobacterium lividum]
MSATKRIAVLACAGVLALSPVVVGGAFIGVSVSAILNQQTHATCAQGGPAEQVAGVKLTSEQLGNAQLIVQAAADNGYNSRAAEIAVATSLQEASLINVSHGDAAGPDSRGLFQQRAHYGPTRVDPVASTLMFLREVVAVKNWQGRALTDVAATVQRPRQDLRGEYARWETLAGELVQRFWPTGTSVAGQQGGSPVITPAVFVFDCAGEDGEGLPAGGAGGVPAGYVVPSTTQGGQAVSYALAQVGKPYIWGGVGPEGYDCSGLMMKAWAAAGVAIPRTTITQKTTGVAVGSLALAQPGDLLFIAGSLGSASNPRHVGMFLGTVNGQAYLIQAPQTGETVRVDPVSRWEKKIVSIRRPDAS